MSVAAKGEPVACPGCDLLQRIPPLPVGGKACCSQCGEILATSPPDPLDRALALTIAAAVTFVVANTTQLLGLSAAGRRASTTILGGALQMWLEGREVTAVFVAFCSVIAPAVYIALMLAVLLAVRMQPVPHWVGRLLRWADVMRPWSMSEVMMLGILVALTKIASLATVITGIGMYAVGLLMILLAAIKTALDPREIWERAEWATPDAQPRGSLAPPASSPRP